MTTSNSVNTRSPVNVTERTRPIEFTQMIEWAIGRDFIGPTCQVVSVSAAGRMTGDAIDCQVTTISIEGTDIGKLEVCLNRGDRRGDATCYSDTDDEVVGPIFSAVPAITTAPIWLVRAGHGPDRAGEGWSTKYVLLHWAIGQARIAIVSDEVCRPRDIGIR